MAKSVLLEIEANFDGKKIVLAKSTKEISDLVIDGNVIILKNVFDKNEVLDLRKKVIEWANNNNPVEPSSEPDDRYLMNNYHRYDNLPPESHTPHISHFFNFMRIDLLPPDLSKIASKVYGSLRDLQNALSGTKGNFLPTNEPVIMRPQVIHYPAGGGFFGEHSHPFEPQRIGLILSLSQKNIDYKIGSTTFQTPQGIIDTQNYHDIGDICLFRYNLLHTVTSVDPDKKINWDSDKGRWTIILPYY